MLKWSARAFAMAAALQFGFASAQDTDAGVDLVPPGPAAPANEAELEAEAVEESREAAQELQEQNREALENAQEQQREAQESLRDARDEAVEDARDIQEDAFQQQEDGIERQQDAIEREARFRPEGDNQGIDDRIRAATANLDIDDETRSRYRWHNGEWWFKTKSGNWKYYRDSRWQDFDPTTYQSINSGANYGAPQAGYRTEAYGAPQQYGASDGYYSQGRFYQSTRPYGAYRPNYDNYNRGYYNDGLNRGYGYNQGFYGNPGYGNPGYGYQGYNPANDRFQGYDAYGRPYSMSGDRYRGGVIGSEIGGRIGGSTGAIIGGAIGAEAAE